MVGQAYPFLAALQVITLFAATFLLTSFGLSVGRATAIAAALTLGFFIQYAFDMNSWSQLGSAPLYLLLLGLTTLSLDPARFGTNSSAQISRIGLLIGITVAACLYLYPEAAAVFGLAGMAIVVAGLLMSRWPASRLTIAGLAVGGALGLLLLAPYWEGTAGHFLRQIVIARTTDVDWWLYYQRYLLGREDNYLELLRTSTGKVYLYALFSFPIEALMAAIGLYWVLPTVSWPIWLATTWKLLLYGFAILLFTATGRAIYQTFRERTDWWPLMVGCVIACLLPLAILARGHYWAAGKALAIAGPLLFLLLVLPVLRRKGHYLWIAPAALFIVAHLALGVLRPLEAMRPPGTSTTGMPMDIAGGVSKYDLQIKSFYDWNAVALVDRLHGCRAVTLDIANPFIDRFVQLALSDVGIPWTTTQKTYLKITLGPVFPPSPPLPEADCVAATRITERGAGQRMVLLRRDPALEAFLAGASELEIALTAIPEITTSGLYDVKEHSFGALRWASPTASISVPSVFKKPITSLVVSLGKDVVPAGKTLRVMVDGHVLFDGPAPSEALLLPLGDAGLTGPFTIRIDSTPDTHFTGDPRTLGVPIREIRLIH
jgi:hypothetical protein